MLRLRLLLLLPWAVVGPPVEVERRVVGWTMEWRRHCRPVVLNIDWFKETWVGWV